MSWIGLWDPNGAEFSPNGLDLSSPKRRPDPSPDTFLARGTLVMEFRHDPADHRRNLLRFAAREPWHSSLTILLEPSGLVQVLAGQGEQSTVFALQTEMPGTEKAVILQYSWDAPARTAVLSLRTPEKTTFFLAEFRNPLPLSLRDAERIIQSDAHTTKSPEMVYVAISDEVEPAGPIASIDETAWLDTPKGRRNISDISIGQLLTTADGGTAQVRWVGSQILPARGRYAPCTVHAPFYEAVRDLRFAPEQKLRLGGSMIEYHFGTEEVSASVRHLVDGRAITVGRAPLTCRYYQIVLDEPNVLRMCGTAVETLDPSALLLNPAQIKHSLLRDLPRELLPELPVLRTIPVLRNFEALALAH